MRWLNEPREWSGDAFDLTVAVEPDTGRAVWRAARRARRADTRLHSFATGPDALDGPIATVEMASRTRGYFTPVRHPGDLVDVVEVLWCPILLGGGIPVLSAGVRRDLRLRSGQRFNNGVVQATYDVIGQVRP